ncbi:hypothetical protein J2S28_005718 [Rhizobium sp. SLBN-94]|nr:hypothetical protein [Rhizobium sp. SLBN-94]
MDGDFLYRNVIAVDHTKFRSVGLEYLLFLNWGAVTNGHRHKGEGDALEHSCRIVLKDRPIGLLFLTIFIELDKRRHLQCLCLIEDFVAERLEIRIPSERGDAGPFRGRLSA